MEKNSTKSNNIFVSEEEKIINWSDVQSAFEKNFGSEVYKSWLSNIVLLKEYNEHLVLSVPTRFIRDWVVSRYLDKIIEQVQKFKKSLYRIDFKISEEGKIQSSGFKSNDFGFGKITEIKDSILNYNRLNPNLNFNNFVKGSSNELAFTSAKKACEQISRYNSLYIYGGVGLGKTHLLNAIGLELQESHNVMFISAERFMYHFIKSIKKMIW